MKRMLRKLLSVLLALSLLMSLFTMTAAASGADGWREERAAIETILTLAEDGDSLLAQHLDRGGVLRSADEGSDAAAFTVEPPAPAVLALAPLPLPEVPPLLEVPPLPEELPLIPPAPAEGVEVPSVEGTVTDENGAGNPGEGTTEGTGETNDGTPGETPSEDTNGTGSGTPGEDTSEGTGGANTDASEDTGDTSTGTSGEDTAEGADGSNANTSGEDTAEGTGDSDTAASGGDPSGESGLSDTETLTSTQFSEGPEDPSEGEFSAEPITVTLGEVADEVTAALKDGGVSLAGAVWQVQGGRVFFGYLTGDSAAKILAYDGGWKCGTLPVDGDGGLVTDGAALDAASFESKLHLYGEDGAEILYDTGDLVISGEGAYFITGRGTGANNIVIEADAVVTLDNVTVEDLDSGLSAVKIKPGVNATIIAEGACALTGGTGGSGILVPAGSALDLSGDTLEATGTGTWAAGIGAYAKADFGGSGDITIHDMDSLTAVGGCQTGNTSQTNDEGGPGIGGGTTYDEYTASPVLSRIVLRNCADVTARGGSKAAGIGSGFWNACDIEIADCSVDAVGGSTAPAIGTARNTFNPNQNHDYGAISDVVVSPIVIRGSTVTTQGGFYGAGIGSGYNDKCVGDYARQEVAKKTAVSVEITGGSYVEATGGKLAAGIGGGYKNFGDSVSIGRDCTVYAYAGAAESGGKKIPCGIGSGADGSSLFSDAGGTVSIASGAEVRAFSYGYDAGDPLASKWAVSRELEDGGTSAAVLQCRFLVADSFDENGKGLYSEPIGLFSKSRTNNVILSGAGETYTVRMPAGYTCMAATVQPGTYAVTVDGKVQSSLESIAWSAESGNGTAYASGEHRDGAYANYDLTYQPWSDKTGYEATVRYTFGQPSADFPAASGVNSFDAVAYRPAVEPTRPASFQVTYQWTGAVPAGVTLPGGASVEAGAAYTPDDTFTAATALEGAYRGETGTFTFSGWDRTEVFTVNEDVTLRGVWSFVPAGGTASGTDTDNSGRDDGDDGDDGYDTPADLPDQQVPTADLPDQQVPQSETPAPETPDAPVTDLPEPPVPLADVPETGDGALLWLLASLAGLAALALTGKKRRA